MTSGDTGFPWPLLIVGAIIAYGVARFAIDHYFYRKRRFHVELIRNIKED